MTKEEAMETFCRIAGSKRLVDSPATGQLLTLLDGLPLAIAQVAAYIQTTHTSTVEPRGRCGVMCGAEVFVFFGFV